MSWLAVLFSGVVVWMVAVSANVMNSRRFQVPFSYFSHVVPPATCTPVL